MFDIQCYRNNSPANYVTKKLDLLETLTGTLRDGSSILDPVIMVQANAPGFQSNQVNYIYVAQTGRYYYITNIVSVNYTLWEIHCHVDVLMSYAEQIRQQTAIVARQEGQYNLYLDDGIFMAYQNPLIQTKYFSNDAPFETQEFVLVVAGS